MPKMLSEPAANTFLVEDAPFIRIAVVTRMTGLGKSTIYRLMAEDKFPSPVRIANRAVAWRRADLEQWGQARPRTGL